jgi:phenylacetic acid degradation operon negative regulatory protein
MTIIDELLILLDDLEEASADVIPAYFDTPNLQVIFSSLGRLVNRGWATKKTKRDQVSYSITTQGINELNQTLDTIKREDELQWDQQWRLVVFEIPETRRKLRDSFRVYLKSLGYGMLTSSVWVSPWDKELEIKRFCKRHSLLDNIFYITTVPHSDTYQSTVFAHRCWNWQKIEQGYKTFLNDGPAELRRLDHSDKGRFMAKKLVFQYAETVKEDPQLPGKISPNAMLSKRAHELYARIRPYCLREQ